MNEELSPLPSFVEVKSALLDESRLFPPAFLQFFSDMETDTLLKLAEVWQLVSENRKYSLLEDLEDSLESDTLVNYDEFALMACKDESARVRSQALRLFWDSDNHRVIPILIDASEHDSGEMVRVSAIEILGHFELLSVLDEVPSHYQEKIEKALWNAYHAGSSSVLSRRALESLGYSEDEKVSKLILMAFSKADPEWQASALIAMGHSADDRWQKQILNSLTEENFDIRMAAIKAAGELELKAARVALVKIVGDEENDSDQRYAAIWALSTIGGKEVKQYLEQRLDNAADDEEAEILEEALENIALADDLSSFDLSELG